MIQTKEKIKVMRAEDLPIQIGKEVQMKGMSIALFRLSNGDIRAVENRCPHKKWTVSRRNCVWRIRLLSAA